MRSSLSSSRVRRSVVLTAPWLRAPLLLAHRPAVAMALTGASVILGVTSAATPLYVSSSGNAALHRQAAEACPWLVGPRVTATQELDPQYSRGAGAPFDRRDTLVRRAAADVPNVRAPETTLIAAETAILGPGGEQVSRGHRSS